MELVADNAKFDESLNVSLYIYCLIFLAIIIYSVELEKQIQSISPYLYLLQNSDTPLKRRDLETSSPYMYVFIYRANLSPSKREHHQ